MTNHDESRKTWDGASTSFVVSSPVVKSKPTPRDYEEEDRSVHPRRSNNRDLVRDHALIDHRRVSNSPDNTFSVLSSLKRMSVNAGSNGSVDESYSNVPTSSLHRESSVDDINGISLKSQSQSQRGSTSSENGESNRQQSVDKNPDSSQRSGDGSNRGWCNFCFETGHTGTECPWHPKIPVNDAQLAGGWNDSSKNGKSPTLDSSTEWPGVEYEEEGKDRLQENLERNPSVLSEFGQNVEERNSVYINKKEEAKLEHPHHSRYVDQIQTQSFRDIHFSPVHDRSWGSRSAGAVFNHAPTRRDSTPSFPGSNNTHNNSGGGWISVDPSKQNYDDALVRLHQDNSKRGMSMHTMDTDYKSGFYNEDSFHSTRGADDYENAFNTRPSFSEYPLPHNDTSDNSRYSYDYVEDTSVDASFRSFDSDTSVGSTRSADSRRRAGGSRSADPSGSQGRTNSATVTIIAPSVITFMHPRVPAKAVPNSPAKGKPRPVDHRRNVSQGFAPYPHPSSPTHKPQDYYNDQRSVAAAAMRANYTNEMSGHHRMDSVMMEAPKKQSVDETVGIVPPVIGKRCHKCWGYGHLHAQCPSRNGGANAKNSRDGSWKQCRYCRERGHVFSDCPHLRSTQNMGYANSNLNTSPVQRITPGPPLKSAVNRPL